MNQMKTQSYTVLKSITRHKYKKIELCMVQKLVESDVEGMKIIQKHPSKGIL